MAVQVGAVVATRRMLVLKPGWRRPITAVPMLSPSPAPRPHPNAAVAERRSSPRVEVISCVQGEAGTGDAVILINISEGGAMVHGSFQPTRGEVHEFRFVGEDGTPPLVFAARVVHVLPVSTHVETTYALGLEFVTTTEHQRRSIDALLASCTTQN